jgi:hypothetical protein
VWETHTDIKLHRILMRGGGEQNNQAEWWMWNTAKLFSKSSYRNAIIDQIEKDELGRKCSTHRADENNYEIVNGNSEGKNQLEDLGVCWRITLKWILKINRVWGCGLNPSGLVQYPVIGCCEHGNETSGSMKRGEFLGQLSNYQFLKMDFSLRNYLVI